MKQTDLAADQFGASAFAYLRSEVHAQGGDLQRLTNLSSSLHCPAALDLGCGAGHASFAMAQGGASVTAYDLSEKMLDIVKSESRQRSLGNIEVRQGPAERLPFADSTFDLVATRFSAHHWMDVPAAMREVRRVLKAQGTFVVIDVVAAESPLLDTMLQTVEMLRDASHVRDYRITEWVAMLESANFATPATDTWILQMEFATWVARMRTPQLRANAIRDVLASAAEEARQHFQMQPDGSFNLDVAWMQTRPRE